MNKMEKVANMLGVELGEEFDLIYKNGMADKYNPYKIGKNGLFDCEGSYASIALHRLVTGEWTIKKAPWKPQDEEYYYYIDFTCENSTIECAMFDNRRYVDKCNIKQNNYFTTEALAQKALDKIKQVLGECEHEDNTI